MNDDVLVATIDELLHVGAYATPDMGEPDEFGLSQMAEAFWKAGYLQALTDLAERAI